MSWKVLVVEDESDMLDMAQLWLGNEGHRVIRCASGSEAMNAFNQHKPDVVVLDWMLPGMDGIDILPMILSQSPNTPVIMATAKTDDDEIGLAWELGAVDYIKKPYRGRELVSRVSAAMTRIVRKDTSRINIGPIEIDVSAYEVRRHGQKVLLTPLEFNLLLTIAETPEHTFTREELLREVWKHKNLPDASDMKSKVDTRLVNVHIQRLRAKIEENPDDPQIVTTVRGRGYKAGAF